MNKRALEVFQQQSWLKRRRLEQGNSTEVEVKAEICIENDTKTCYTLGSLPNDIANALALALDDVAKIMLSLVNLRLHHQFYIYRMNKDIHRKSVITPNIGIISVYYLNPLNLHLFLDGFQKKFTSQRWLEILKCADASECPIKDVIESTDELKFSYDENLATLELFNFLLRKGCILGPRTIVYAIDCGNLLLLKRVLEEIAKRQPILSEKNEILGFKGVRESEPPSSRSCIDTALRATIISHRLDMLQLIRAADETYRYMDPWFTVHAAHYGYVDILEYFIKERNIEKETPFECYKAAFECGHVNVIESLYKHGFRWTDSTKIFQAFVKRPDLSDSDNNLRLLVLFCQYYKIFSGVDTWKAKPIRVTPSDVKPLIKRGYLRLAQYIDAHVMEIRVEDLYTSVSMTKNDALFNYFMIKWFHSAHPNWRSIIYQNIKGRYRHKPLDAIFEMIQ